MNDTLAENSRLTPAWNDCHTLFKSEVVQLILFTAEVGAVTHHRMDRRTGAVMARAKTRPLPRQPLSPPHTAVVFVGLMASFSWSVLTTLDNLLIVMLTCNSMTGYAIVPTVFLKPAWPWF